MAASVVNPVYKELQTLTKKLTELETSNAKVLRKLTEDNKERLDSSFNTNIAEFHTILNSLKTKSCSRDQDLQTLKENVSKLNEEITKLSLGIDCFKNEGISVSRKRENANSKGAVDITKDGEPKQRTLTPTESGKSERTATNGENQNCQASSETYSEKFGSTVKEDVQSQGSPERPPLCRNKYGLKYRSVSINNDNRVKVLECIERETPQSFQNKSSPQTRDGLNLPTRDALEKPQSNQKADGTRPTPKYDPRPQSTKNEYRNLAGLNKDPDDVNEVKDLDAWKSLAESEKLKGQLLCPLKKGKGPDTCLLLDMSGSMAGKPFNEMMAAVRAFVEGISTISVALGITENIGITTFGAQTEVVLHMTNEYDKALEALELMFPSGPSPMAAGLYMALACCLGHTARTSIRNVPVGSRIILFSDGRGTPDTTTAGEDDRESPFEFMKEVWLKEAAEDLERRKIRVYTVPVCSTDTKMMETVCRTTHGKMYSVNETHKLIKMTQNTVQAINMIENGTDFGDISAGEQSSSEYSKYLRGPDWEEVEHLGKFLVNQASFMCNTELEDSHLPPLGSRVRRGPDWHYGNQDQGGPGTVVGHDRDHIRVWVEWDCGHLNVYTFSPLFGRDLVLVDEPRILTGEIIAVGCLVERGDDWKFRDQDGGVGNIGVVINVNANGNILVRWPNKKKRRYKFGCDGLFEVKLCDRQNTNERNGTRMTKQEKPVIGAEKPESSSILKLDENNEDRRSPKVGGSMENVSDKETMKRLSIEELNRRNRHMQTKEQTDLDNIVWTYKKDGEWHRIPKDINDKMEKAYGRNKHGSTILELDGHIWRAKFSDMKMTCQKTHACTEIARTESTS